jgi:hypothetical protein
MNVADFCYSHDAVTRLPQFNRFKQAALSLPTLFSHSVCAYFDADVRECVQRGPHGSFAECYPSTCACCAVFVFFSEQVGLIAARCLQMSRFCI